MEFSTIDLYPDSNNKVRTLVVWLGIVLVSCLLVRFFEYVFKIFHHWRTPGSSELVYHGSEMYLLQHNPRDDFLDKEELEDLDSLATKSLWHQLTTKLLDIVKADVFRGEAAAKHLYDKYIKPWQEKMNPLLLAEMLLYVVSEYSDTKEAIDILEKTESVVKKNNLALSLCKVIRASTMLDVQGDIEGSKKLMNQLEPLLDVADQTTFVHGLYHKLCCKWHRLQGNHADAYRAGFRYLGCTELKTIPIEQQEDLAVMMIESGLAGEDVYDLGHLISHPILDSLTDLPEVWHLELLQAVNDGNSLQVDTLMPQIQSNTVLCKHLDLIRRKTHLLSLMQLCMTTSKNGRRLPLEEISKKVRVPLNSVELLVMKALALGLIQGHIDQVDDIFAVEWVQPRIISKSQLKPFIYRLDEWCKTVEEIQLTFESHIDNDDFFT